MTAPKTPGRTLTDFKNDNDPSIVIPRKIEAALARLANIGEFRTAVEFQKESGVSVTDLALYREQYEEFIVVTRKDGKQKDNWFGDKAMAAEARASVR